MSGDVKFGKQEPLCLQAQERWIRFPPIEQGRQFHGQKAVSGPILGIGWYNRHVEDGSALHHQMDFIGPCGEVKETERSIHPASGWKPKVVSKALTIPGAIHLFNAIPISCNFSILAYCFIYSGSRLKAVSLHGFRSDVFTAAIRSK